MKTFIFLATAFFFFSSPVKTVAQKPAKVVISVPGAQDEWCKTHIENYLKREYGVVSTNVNYRRHVVTVLYLTDRTNIENIKTAIANLGYDADDVTANPDSYKKLPIDHRHPVPPSAEKNG